MWRLLPLLIALPALAQDARPLLGPGTLPPRAPVTAAPSAIEAPPAPARSDHKAPGVLPADGPAPDQPDPIPDEPAMPPAAGPARCTPAREGEVACMSGRLCACRFERGGQLTGRPDRFVWDCGPLRPSCDQPPAELPGPPMPDIQIFPQITPMPRR